MQQVFNLVNNYLHPGGIFVFDLNTEYKFKNIYGENTFSEVDDDAVYIWENYYDEEERINEYYLNFFVKNSGGTYDRTQEEHYEEHHSLDEIKKFIKNSGMKFEAAYDAFTFEPVRDDSERICGGERSASKGEMKMGDYILRATAANDSIRAFAATTRGYCTESKENYMTLRLWRRRLWADCLPARSNDGRNA
ncbi:MAG: hypothetical protein ACLTM8_00300 [Veillonella parvula]